MTSNSRRIALVTQGFTRGGGMPSVAEWLREGLRAVGHRVDLHDLATSNVDPNSRRLLRPPSWFRESVRGPFDEASAAQRWGANLVELEPMRYHRRAELSKAMRDYDLIQVVAGGPALAWAVAGLGPPVFLQVASRLRWERRARRAVLPPTPRIWSDVMTAWATRLEVKALRAVDGVFVENAEMLKYVRTVGQQKVILAPPGVDTDRFRPATDGWNPRGYLLSVCRLAEPRKRLDRLVEAYGDLVRADASVPTLVLAGRGQMPPGLRERITSAGLGSRVDVREDVPAAELPELYRGASVYVQTSQEEGLGISVLEAMASGLPVVATDTAGARECVEDGVTGLLVRQHPERAVASVVADRLRDVLTRSDDAMALAARERCNDAFSTNAALTRFTSLYDRLLAPESGS